MNLRDDCYDDFADYIAKAVKGIEKRDGVKFDYVSPVNEPDGHWNWHGPKQEEIGGGGGYDFTMKTALYVARLIHHDLCFADAESWSWWRAAGGDYKDGLLRVYAKDGMEDGRAVDSKLLWAFGNFSRFIRPGAVRYEISVRNEDGSIKDEGWNEPIRVSI